MKNTELDLMMPRQNKENIKATNKFKIIIN